MKHKALIINLAVMTVTTLLMLLSAEGYLRYMAYQKDQKLMYYRSKLVESFDMSGYSEVTAAFGFMTKISKHERVIYELKPHLNMRYMGSDVITSRNGFRDQEYPWQKDADTVRIVGIGDSIMFGQGVEQHESYLEVLERTLNEKHPELNWEVLNTGVPEYNTMVEVELLKARGLKYQPDIVVLGYCSNDFELPNIAQVLGLPDKIDIYQRYLTLSRSFALQYVRQKLDLVKYFMPNLPNKYAGMSGQKGVTDALMQLFALSKKYGFEVIVLISEPGGGKRDRYVKMTSSGLAFHTVDFSRDIGKYMKQNDIAQYRGSVLTVPDGHPSALTHSLISDRLYRYMRSSGLVRKYQNQHQK